MGRPASPWLSAPATPPQTDPELPKDTRDTGDSDARLPTPKPTWKQRAWTLSRRVMRGAMLGGSILSAIGFHANEAAAGPSEKAGVPDLFLRISPTPALVGQEPGALPQNP